MRVLAIAAALIILGGCSKPVSQQQPGRAETSATADAGPVKGLDRSHKGSAPPATATFKNPDGGDISLAAFKGTPVLVNLWASWCIPCVKELPTLDALARSHRADGRLGVVAVSQDSGPHASVVAFLAKHKIADLAAYQDAEMHLSFGLDAPVLPTSVLYDAQGREVWRYVGDFDWTSAEAGKLLAEAGA
jgi:thiol-disulfide isomerase/thioredoxin